MGQRLNIETNRERQRLRRGLQRERENAETHQVRDDAHSMRVKNRDLEKAERERASERERATHRVP